MDWQLFGIGYLAGFITASYIFYLFWKAREKKDIVHKAIKRAVEEQN
jgi:hypothetical protein